MSSLGRTLFLLFIIVLATPVYSLAGDASQEQTRFDYAYRLYMQGAYDSAVKEFKDYLRDYPKGQYSDDAGYWLGKYYESTGKYEDALGQFKAIVTLLPSSDKAPASQFEIAGYWYDPSNPRHDYEKAIAEYLKIPFFYPDSPVVPDSLYYAALCQMKLRNYAKAEEELRALVQKYPSSELAPPAAYKLGMACLLQGKTDDALASFQSVRDKYPAGLFRQDALSAVELIMRAKEKRPLSVEYTYGAKGEAPGMLYKPTDAALDGQGGLYVSDSGNGRVQRFKAAAGSLTPDMPSLALPAMDKALQPVRPAGVAVGPRGRVYLTDSSLHRVQVYQPDGDLVLTIGRKGAEPGSLSAPSGIAVDEGGDIYIADTGNKRVDRFDPEGRFVRSAGSSGTSEDNFLKSPSGVAFDVEGNLLVTDSSTNQIYKYDQSGKLLAVAGSKSGAYSFGEPAGIGVDVVGNVYVVDRDKASVAVFDRDLKLLMEFPGQGGKKVFDTPSGIAVSGNGEVFVVDPGLNQIVVLK